MSPEEHLELLLVTVGKLRVKLSQIMRSVHETREACKKQHRYPPEELSPLMGQAQELFAELLKASEFLATTSENLKNKRVDRQEIFDNYLDTWVKTQTTERFNLIESYLEDVSQTRIEGLHLDPTIWEEGLGLIQQTRKPA